MTDPKDPKDPNEAALDRDGKPLSRQPEDGHEFDAEILRDLEGIESAAAVRGGAGTGGPTR